MNSIMHEKCNIFKFETTTAKHIVYVCCYDIETMKIFNSC